MNLLPVQPIIDRLKANAPGLRQVGGAADLAAVQQTGAVVASPSAFVVVLGAESHEIAEGSGPLRQTFDVTFSVALAVTLAGLRGEAGVRATEGPADEIRTALFGWWHPNSVRSCWSAGESVEDFNAKSGVLLYRLDFVTQVRIQETL